MRQLVKISTLLAGLVLLSVDPVFASSSRRNTPIPLSDALTSCGPEVRDRLRVEESRVQGSILDTRRSVDSVSDAVEWNLEYQLSYPNGNRRWLICSVSRRGSGRLNPRVRIYRNSPDLPAFR